MHRTHASHKLYNGGMKLLIIVLGLLAVLLVAGLAWYAWQLWRGVWAKDTAHSQAAALRQRDARADQINSVRVLAKSMLDGDLNVTEGAIRLKVLLDHLYPDGSGEKHYPDLYALYNATEHMPRGRARAQQPPAEIRKLDEQREALEAQYRDAVLRQAREVRDAFSAQ